MLFDRQHGGRHLQKLVLSCISPMRINRLGPSEIPERMLGENNQPCSAGTLAQASNADDLPARQCWACATVWYQRPHISQRAVFLAKLDDHILMSSADIN